eukprot:scaffold1340_cov122-Cylindrotheca_fusiformis.AAC.19
MFTRIIPTLRGPAGVHLGYHARRHVSATIPTLEKHTIKVPSMGDSITEGTIVEWTAQVGQMVKDGDVVALVETDKVTVDIKAEMDGVLTQQFGEIEDTVEVGANLYELDTEAEATVTASNEGGEEPAAPEKQGKEKEPAAKPDAKPDAAKEKSAPAKQAPEKSREPSIQFLGKDGWAQRLSTAKDEVVYLPKDYGRPKFSEAEIEALITGGANIAPTVKEPSRGAIFQWGS